MEQTNYNPAFYGIAGQSSQKRYEFRMMKRQRHMNEKFKQARDNYLPKKQKLNIQDIMNNFSVPDDIVDLSRFLQENEEIELKEIDILKLIECYYCFKNEEQEQKHIKLEKTSSQISYCTPTKMMAHLAKKPQNQQQSTGKSTSNHSKKIQQFSPRIFLIKLLFILTNQTSKNSWEAKQEANDKILGLCFQIFEENVRELKEGLMNASLYQYENERNRNIILMGVIILGNLCQRRNMVVLVERGILRILVEELWPLLGSSFYEDLSFLMANILYHFSLEIIVQEESSEHQIKTEWEQILYLYRFVCSEFLNQIRSYWMQSEEPKKSTFKPIRFKHTSQEYNRYYRHDLMDSITKIRHLALLFIKQFPSLQKLITWLIHEFTQIPNNFQQNLFSKTTQATCKIAQRLEKMRIIQRQNNCKYLYGEENEKISEREYLEVVAETVDMLRFVRDSLRLSFGVVRADILGFHTYLQNCSTRNILQKLIYSHCNTTTQNQQLKINSYCWQIIEQSLSFTLTLLSELSYPQLNQNQQQKFKQLFRCFEEQLAWLESCMTHKSSEAFDQQSYQASLIFYKLYPGRFLVRLKNRVGLFSSGEGREFRKDFAGRYLVMMKENLNRYWQQRDHKLVQSALQSLKSILKHFSSYNTNYYTQKQMSHTKQGMLTILLKEQQDALRIDFQTFLRDMLQKYSYLQAYKDEDEQFEEIRSIIVEIVDGEPNEDEDGEVSQ